MGYIRAITKLSYGSFRQANVEVKNMKDDNNEKQQNKMQM